MMEHIVGLNEDILGELDSVDENPSTRDAYKTDVSTESYHLPENPDLLDKIMSPYNSFKAYYNRTRHNFGWRFLFLIMSTHTGVKGFLYHVIALGQLPFYKNFLHASSETYQVCMVVAVIPWAMKPLFGTISDLYPIKGYHKRYYIMGAAIAGTLAFMALGLLPISSPTIASLFFFCASCELSIIDLLVEGQYAEIMTLKPTTGGDITSWVWGVYMIGSLVAAALVGTLAELFGPRVIFTGAILCASQVLIPISIGWLPEKKLSPTTNIKAIAIAKFRKQNRLFTFAIMMAVGALGLAIVDLVFDPFGRLIYSIISSTLLCVAGFWALPRMVAKANMYMFCTQALYIVLNGPLDYFYTAPNKEDCIEQSLNGDGCDCWVEGGPSFSFVTYLTTASLLSTAAGSLGVVIFQTYMGKWKFRRVFWVTSVLRCVGAMFDIFITARLNITLGIPDRWAYFMGTAVIYHVCYMLDFMPGVILTSKLCPKGVEATVYALLAGFQNFGGTISATVGTFAAPFAGISTSAGNDGNPQACNFDNLPYLIAVCHILLPLIAIPLTFVLIPDARMQDKITAFGSTTIADNDNQDDVNNSGGTDEESNALLLKGSSSSSSKNTTGNGDFNLLYDLKMDHNSNLTKMIELTEFNNSSSSSSSSTSSSSSDAEDLFVD